MELPEVLLVLHILLLPNVIQGTQVPTVTSSLEQTGKEASCPGETVTFTCTTYGSPQLQWYFRGQNVRFVSPPDNVGKVLHREGFNATLDSVNNNDLTSLLVTVFQMDYNRSHVDCSDGRINTTITVLAAGIPSPPTGFTEENRAPMCHHTDVTFTWNPPEYSGKASITMYTLTVLDSITSTTGRRLSVRDTLLNGVNYQVHLTASNCIGDSSPVHLNLNIIGCVSPPPLERGSKSSSCTGENSVVQYQCDHGLVLLGESVVTCMEDGNWSPNPHELSCKANCGRIDYLKNGKVIISDNTLEDSVISYSCNDGYVRHGTHSSTCGSNGMWSPDPHDTICRAVCMIPQAPINGTIVVVSTDLVEGAEAEYKCDEGLFPNGARVATCTDTGNGGEWIPNPVNDQCRKQALCSAIVPSTVHLLVQSFQLPTEGNDGAYFCQTTEGILLNKTEGHTAVYFCQVSDGTWVNKTTTCSSNGTWTPEVECPEQGPEQGSASVSCNTALAGAVVSSIMTSTLVSLLLGCLSMWCIMTKLTQRKETAEEASSTERNSPLESSTAPYYTDVRVREEQFKFKINVNAAYAKSGQ